MSASAGFANSTAADLFTMAPAATHSSSSLAATALKLLAVVFVIGNYKVIPFKWTFHFYYYVVKYLFVLPRLAKFRKTNTVIARPGEKLAAVEDTAATGASSSVDSSTVASTASSSTTSLARAAAESLTATTTSSPLPPPSVANSLFTSDHTAPGLYRANDYRSRTVALECDMNGHKNNATYFTDMDLARSDLLLGQFAASFLHYRAVTGGYPYVPLGAVACVFKRELRPYQAYVVRSRVLGWDHKWLFVVSRFEFAEGKNKGSNAQRGKLAAVGLSKYVFKLGRRTLPPEEFMAHSYATLGVTETDVQRGRMEFGYAKGLIEAEAVLDLEL